jgi:hypothetical protein
MAFWTDRGLNEEDHTWHYVKNTNWCLMEAWIGVFCACLPSMKCLFVHHFPGVFSSNRNMGHRRSLLSMIRIPVTDVRDEPQEGTVLSAWQIVSRVRKKPSCGSSEPDLEAQGDGDDQASSNSDEGRREKDEGSQPAGGMTVALKQLKPASSRSPD